MCSIQTPRRKWPTLTKYGLGLTPQSKTLPTRPKSPTTLITQSQTSAARLETDSALSRINRSPTSSREETTNVAVVDRARRPPPPLRLRSPIHLLRQQQSNGG